MKKIINEQKHLCIEFEDERKENKYIRNLWYCRVDQANNVLEYNTEDNTMQMQSISLDDISAFYISREWQLEDEPKNTRHSEWIFNWEKDFDRNYRRRWEE